LAEPVADAMEQLLAFAVNQADWDPLNTTAFEAVGQAQDPRLVWALTDMLRFAWRPEFRAALANVAETILHTSFRSGTQRADILNSMMAWDMPDGLGEDFR